MTKQKCKIKIIVWRTISALAVHFIYLLIKSALHGEYDTSMEVRVIHHSIFFRFFSVMVFLKKMKIIPKMSKSVSFKDEEIVLKVGDGA